MHCVPPQELQGRLEEANIAYVILAGSSLSAHSGKRAVESGALSCRYRIFQVNRPFGSTQIRKIF